MRRFDRQQDPILQPEGQVSGEPVGKRVALRVAAVDDLVLAKPVQDGGGGFFRKAHQAHRARAESRASLQYAADIRVEEPEVVYCIRAENSISSYAASYQQNAPSDGGLGWRCDLFSSAGRLQGQPQVDWLGDHGEVQARVEARSGTQIIGQTATATR